MGKRLILVLALALLVGMTFSAAYAEVQNVKVSGDINILAVLRNNFDLGNPPSTVVGFDGGGSASGPVNSTKENDKGRFFATQTRVRIDADLTDNVMATVRLINERNWTSETNSNTNIDLDLAYVTLKEFLYSPLTLTLGRQELKFGNQLIIGSNNTYTFGAVNGVPADLSERTSFDALRATLNYDPLVVDLVYAKASNNDVNSSDDVDLFGVNASYNITKMLNVQGYIWDRKDKSAPSVSDNKKDDIYTVGTLVTLAPIEGLKASLEGAYQFGQTRNNTGTLSEKRNAWALQALADYTFTKCKLAPSIGAGFTYLSGRDKNNGWNQMYYNEALNPIAYAILPFTDLQVINLRTSIKPMEDVTVSAKYGNYRFAKAVDSFTTAKFDSNGNRYVILCSGKKDAGNELDLGVTYDYTEDVQIGLNAGWFMAGGAINDNGGTRDATQLIGSMRVTL